MTKYQIKKVIVTGCTGRFRTAYNVIDPSDGYIFETFYLKRDAKYWIDQTLAFIKANN